MLERSYSFYKSSHAEYNLSVKAMTYKHFFFTIIDDQILVDTKNKYGPC